jgi:hypothetical protein
MLSCHRQFVAADPRHRQGITAIGSGHVIFRENPPLVTEAIVKAYAGTRSKPEADAIMKRYRAYSIKAAIKARKKDVQYPSGSGTTHRFPSACT